MTDIRSDIIINVDTSIGIAEIKNLQRQIAELNAQLLKSGAQQAKAAQNIQRNLINNINATGNFAANVRTISSTAESFTTALERNKLGMGEYFKYAGGASKTFGRLFRREFDTIQKVAESRVKTLQTQYVKLGRDANGALKAISVRPLVLDMDNLATKTAIAAQKQQLFNQLIKQGSTNLLNFGKNTQWAGRQLMVGFSIPLAYLGTIASKTFMKMEEQAIRFKRVYGDSFTASAETDKMIKQVQELAQEFTKYGVAVEKTMEMAADAAAMGLMNADLLAQINQATRLSVLGGVEQEQALDTTISLMNAFGTSAKDLTKDIDFLNAVENQTVTAIEDLTIAIPKAAPVIKQLGGDVQDLAFFLTAMKEGGINASEGANALKSGLASLINPAEKSAKFLENLGININGIVEGNAGDVKSTVIEFAQALDTLDPLNRARAIEQLFGKFQFSRLSTLFQNVVKEGTQAQRVLEITRQSSEELAILSERELKRVEDSPMFKFQKAMEDLKVSLVPLGEAFLKAITPVIEFAKGFLDRFNEMGEGAKSFAVIATTVVAGIGPILLMTFGLIANGVANLIKMFSAISGIFRGAGKSSVDLGNSTEYMTQQQLEAAAVAASLDQSHAKLIQTFGLEAAAVDKLAIAYSRAVVAQSRLLKVPIGPRNPAGQKPMKLRTGIVSVPGPKGAGDIVPAMLSPGEAVIPAKQTEKYSGLIRGMINDDIPGFRFGRFGAAAKRQNPFTSIKEAIQPKNSNWSLLEGLVRYATKQRKHWGPSVTTYERELSEKFLRRRSSKNVAVRMFSDDMVGSLQRGDTRYKNVFETGGQSRGSLDKPGGQRAIAEEKLFGIKPDADPTSRPAYGYLFNRDIDMLKTRREPLLNRMFGIKSDPFSPASSAKYRIDEATKLMNEKTYRYGDIAMVLKNRAVRGRTTMTQGDSLNSFLNQYATPAKLGTRNRGKLRAAVPSKTNNEFFEAQILGGFSFKDIKRIVATEPQTIIRLQEALRTAGIKGVKVGMPRYTMMQKLQKLVYGKKAFDPKMPRIQPESSGKYAGSYRPDPRIINGRTFWNKGGVTSEKDAQKPTSRSFNQDYALQAAHMSPAATLPDGNENFTAKQAIDRIRQEYRDGIAKGLLVDSPLLRDNLNKTIFAINQEAKSGRTFKLYGNNVGLMTASANQKVANKKSMKEASWFLEKLSLQSRGQLASSQMLTLIDGAKALGLPGYSVSQSGIKTYSIATDNEYRRQLKALGNRQIGEDELHKLYKLAGQKALGGFPDGPDKTALSRLTGLGALNLTAGYVERGASGPTRPGKMSLFQQKMQEVAHSKRNVIAEIFGKGYTDDFFGAGKSKVQNITREQKKAIEKLVSPIENDPQKRKEYMKLAERIKAAYDKGPSELNKLLGLSESPKPATKAKEIKTTEPKSTAQKRQPEIVNASDILARGTKLAPPPKPRRFGRVFGFNSGVVSVPGPKGAGDIVPAMLSPGEAVIPTKMADKYAPLINSMIAGNIPGYQKGKGKKGPKFGANYTGTQTQRSTRPGTVLTETNPQPGVVTQKRVSSNVTQKELATLKKQLKGSTFKRSINAITTNVSGAIATGIQNANLAKVMTKDYVAGYKERYKAEKAITDRQMAERDKRIQKETQAKRDAKWNKKYSEATNAKMFGPNYKDATSGKFVSADTVNSRFDQFRSDKKQAKLQARSDAKFSRSQSKFANRYGDAGLRLVKSGSGASYQLNNKFVNQETARAKMAEADDARRAKRKETFQANKGKIGAGAAGLGGAGMMASMAMSMSDDPNMQKASGAVMMGSAALSMLPMLMNPVGAVIASFGALAAAIYLINDQFSKSAKAAYELEMATGGSSQAIRAISQFSGNVTAGEQMDRRREEGVDVFQTAAGKTGFGASFLESDAGKSLYSGFAEVYKTQGKDAAAGNLKNQMMTAVASGALDAGQARDVVSAIGKQLNDYSFSINVNSQLLNMLGPNGENLLKDPLGVRLDILKENQANVEKFGKTFSEKIDLSIANGLDQGGFVGAAAASGALIGGIIGTAILPGVGTAIGAGVGAIAGGLASYFGTKDQFELSAETIGGFTAASAIALQGQQEMQDSLQVEYEQRIAIAKAAGDLAEVTRLQNEYEASRNTLLLENANTVKSIQESFSQSDQQDQILAQYKTMTDEIYKDDPLMKGILGGLEEKLSAVEGEKQVVLRAALLSEDLSPLALDNILNSENSEKQIDLLVNLGATGLTAVNQTADLFGDTTVDTYANADDARTGKVTKVTAKDQFLSNVGTMSATDPGAALAYQESFNSVIQSFSILGDKGLELGMSYYLENPEELTAANEEIALFEEKAKDGITMEIVQEVYGQEMVDQISTNQAYFDSLPPDQQIVYTTVLRMLGEMDEEALRIQAINAAIANDANFKKESGGLTYNQAVREYGQAVADAMATDAFVSSTAVDATTEGNRTTAAPATTTTRAPAGSKKEDPYEDILKDLKRVRNSTIDVTGGLKELERVLGKKANMKMLGGVESKLLESSAKISAPLADYFASLDEDTQKLYFKINKDGKLVLTKAGKLFKQAFDERAIGNVYTGLQGSLKTMKQQAKATKTLAGYGLDWATASELAGDAELAAAIASGKNAEEIKKIVKLKKEELALTRQLAVRDAVNENLAEGALLARLGEFSFEQQKVISASAILQDYLKGGGSKDDAEFARLLSQELAKSRYEREVSASNAVKQAISDFKENLNLESTIRGQLPNLGAVRVEAILNDSELMELYKSSGGVLGQAFYDRLNQLLADPQVLGQIFENGLSNAFTAFDTQERTIDLKFQQDTKQYTDVEDGIIPKAERRIALIEDQVDDYEYTLDIIADKEKQINEKYDERYKALDLIHKVNQRLIAQQQAQLDIAGALSRGDISAAASAVQAFRAQQAEEQKASQKEALDLAKEKELNAVTAEYNGKLLTRKQIEKEVVALRKQIAEIQEKEIEPAEKALRLRSDERDIAISNVSVLGMQRDQWELIQNAVDQASINNTAFVTSLTAALSVTEALKKAYGELGGSIAGTVTIATSPPAGATTQFTTPVTEKPATGPTLNPSSTGPANVSVPPELTTPPVTTPPVTPAPQMTENEKNIAELTRRVQVTRWRVRNNVYRDGKPLTESQKKEYEELNYKRMREIERLGGPKYAVSRALPPIPPGTTNVVAGHTLPAGFASGGLIPKRFAVGGFAMGTDTVPAMLTPGEFVVRKYAVDNFGVDNLKAINTGKYSGESVYNYEVNINVKSDANADQIAKAVMTQIKRVDSQRIRGNRF
jgi:TP901 family phage tail tape measure protein